MSEKSFDDVNFDKLVAVNSNLIDETIAEISDEFYRIGGVLC